MNRQVPFELAFDGIKGATAFFDSSHAWGP